METQSFSLGDIVALKPHPYHLEVTNIVISGDPTPISPLMVVVEIVYLRNLETKADLNKFKYKCLWFSLKSFRFLDAWIFDTDLKLIRANDKCIIASAIKRGYQIVLKSSAIELAKRKSSLLHDDQSSSSKNGSTVINSLLTFLAPVMSVIEIKPHLSKNPLIDKKTGQKIRWVSTSQVKCLLYDSIAEKVSELTVPLEAIEIVEQVDGVRIDLVHYAIEKNAYLSCKTQERRTIIKPTHLTIRLGKYYVRAYDYILNKMTEIDLMEAISFTVLKTPFVTEIPKFDIEHHSDAGTASFMQKEKLDAIDCASSRKNYIRIKYKNQNDEITFRTLRGYRIARVTENREPKAYLVGFCMLRNAERTFWIDRVQNLVELNVSFD